ncbi:MAG: XdhC/CoxI family protein [Eubacteriales bacterium]|nr:XdhC/CoxI family protein [Eubacteriales bacterium]
MGQLKRAMQALRAAGEPFVLVTVKDGTGSMPRHRGAAMVVRQDGSIVGSVGGGLLEATAIEQARQALAAQQDREHAFHLTGQQAAQSGMICGGSGVLAFRYRTPQMELPEIPEEYGRTYIFGGGHVGLALSKALALLGWPVTVLDDRAAFAAPERFAGAAGIVLPDFEHIPALPVQPEDRIAIVTRGHLGDLDALRWALGQPAHYIGMIGSKRKREMLYQTLRSEGVPQARLDAVFSPIGLDIGAETPEEIAIAIVAEMIAVQSQRKKEEER